MLYTEICGSSFFHKKRIWNLMKSRGTNREEKREEEEERALEALE